MTRHTGPRAQQFGKSSDCHFPLFVVEMVPYALGQDKAEGLWAAAKLLELRQAIPQPAYCMRRVLIACRLEKLCHGFHSHNVVSHFCQGGGVLADAGPGVEDGAGNGREVFQVVAADVRETQGLA